MQKRWLMVLGLVWGALGVGLGAGCGDDDGAGHNNNQNNNNLPEGCGNQEIEGAEVCDGSALGGETCLSQGFTDGVLSCNAACDGYDTSQCTSVVCGDDTTEPPEVCDGTDLDGQSCETQGFSGGTLGCTSTCDGFDTGLCFTCGDGTREAGEVCDGSDLGGRTCGDEGFLGGTLACAATCDAYDVSGCEASVCGDDQLHGAEVCDTSQLGGLQCTDLGFSGGTLACNATCTGYDTSGCTGPATPTAFRISEMYMRDPHMYVPMLCADVTDAPFMGFSINQSLNDSIQTDGDTDGLLDVSLLALLRPLDQAGSGAGIDFAVGDCTAPLATTSCGLDLSTPPETTTYSNQATGACLSPWPSTLSPAGYTPAVTVPTDNCFHTGMLTWTFDFSGIPIVLQNVQLAAVYQNTPADTLLDGLMTGFLSEADAANTLVDIPQLGQVPLSTMLPGGSACAGLHDDRDVGIDGVTTGWWFYFNFTAEAVTYTGP